MSMNESEKKMELMCTYDADRTLKENSKTLAFKVWDNNKNDLFIWIIDTVKEYSDAFLEMMKQRINATNSR